MNKFKDNIFFCVYCNQKCFIAEQETQQVAKVLDCLHTLCLICVEKFSDESMNCTCPACCKLTNVNNKSFMSFPLRDVFASDLPNCAEVYLDSTSSSTLQNVPESQSFVMTCMVDSITKFRKFVENIRSTYGCSANIIDFNSSQSEASIEIVCLSHLVPTIQELVLQSYPISNKLLDLGILDEVVYEFHSPEGKSICDEALHEIGQKTNTKLKVRYSHFGGQTILISGPKYCVDTAKGLLQDHFDFGIEVNFGGLNMSYASSLDSYLPSWKSSNVSRLNFLASTHDEEFPLSSSLTSSVFGISQSLQSDDNFAHLFDGIKLHGGRNQQQYDNNDNNISIEDADINIFSVDPHSDSFFDSILNSNDGHIPTITPIHEYIPATSKESKSQNDNCYENKLILSIEKFKLISKSKDTSLKSLYKKFKVSISTLAVGDDQVVIEIKGKQDDVISATKLIDEAMENQSNCPKVEFKYKSSADLLNTAEMYCPTDKVSLIIGSKGVIIKEISRRSKAQISISEESKTYSFIDGNYILDKPNSTTSEQLRKIDIRGSPSEIEIAKTLITTIIEEGPNSIYKCENLSIVVNVKTSVEIPCPKDKVGAIIGSKGSVVRELIRTTNTQISVGDEVISVSSSIDNGLIEARMVTIKGLTDDVNKASLIIEEIIKGNLEYGDPANISSTSTFNDISHGKVHTHECCETLMCPIEKVGEVIGWKGAIVRSIAQQSNCKIVLIDDATNQLTKLIEIKGHPDKIPIAISLLKDIINKCKSKLFSKSSQFNDVAEEFHEKFTLGFEILNVLSLKILYTAHICACRISIDFDSCCIDIFSDDSSNLKIFSSYLSDLQLNNLVECLSNCIEETVDVQSEKLNIMLANKGDGFFKDVTIRCGAVISCGKSIKSGLLAVRIYGKQSEIDLAKEVFTEAMSDTSYSPVSSPNRKAVADKRGYSPLRSTKEPIESQKVGELMDNLLHVDDFIASCDEDEDDDKNFVKFSIECPNEKVGLIIGSKGVVIKSMMNRSKAKIIVTSNTVNGKTVRHVEITGTDAQVHAAKEMVECVIEHGNEALDQSGEASLGLGIITKHIVLPSDQIKNIFGHKGNVMRKIHQLSSASVAISKSSDDDMKQITIKGTLPEVQRATELIELYGTSQIEIESAESLPESDAKSHCFTPPRSRKVQNTKFEGVILDNDDSNSSDNENTTKVTNRPSVASPKKKLSSRSLICPLVKVGSLIGTKGSVIKEIMKRTGASIVVEDYDPASGVDHREVTIRGSNYQLLEAERLVSAILETGTKVLNKS